MMRCLALAVLSVIAWAALPALASASTASVDGTTVNLVGGDEASDIQVRRGGTDRQIVIEDAAGVQAGAGCAQQSETQVECGDAGTSVVQAALGDGADRLDTTISDIDFGIAADGGPGNDNLSGGNRDDTRDVLVGGPGDDTITAADVAYGGDGADNIEGSSYHDELHGEAGPDTMNGNAGDDTVYGDADDDSLNGGSGNDVVEGGDGADSLAGDSSLNGAGNDVFNTRDGVRDAVACGFGADVVNADDLDVADAECEQVDRESASPGGGAGPPFTMYGPRRVSLATFLRRGVTAEIELGGAADIAVALVLDARTAKRLRVGRRQTIVGGAQGRAEAGRTPIRLKPFKRYRRKLKRARRFTVHIAFEATDASGTRSDTLSFSVRR